MKLLATIILVVAICIVSVTYLAVRGSLPVLDGSISIAGLISTVVVERDALGVPTIRGANRLDVARATGFLHTSLHMQPPYPSPTNDEVTEVRHWLKANYPEMLDLE